MATLQNKPQEGRSSPEKKQGPSRGGVLSFSEWSLGRST